jgi:hypothetical protein
VWGTFFIEAAGIGTLYFVLPFVSRMIFDVIGNFSLQLGMKVSLVFAWIAFS